LGGRVASGQTGEIKIQLFADRPIAGELEIIDSNGLTKYPVQLDEQKEKTLWLPVTPKLFTPVEVRLITNSDRIIEKKLTFEHSRTSLTIISNTVPVDQTLNDHHQPTTITPNILSTTDLPHVPQAYAGIEAIWLIT